MATHGVDYLIDYYALLGVGRDASPEDITKAYRKKQMQYHPDRFQDLAPELLAEAERHSNLLNTAYKILGTEEARRLYDQQLAAWDRPLSKRGEVIIDLKNSHFSFETLLEHVSSNPEEREQHAEELAREFSGFQKETYEFFVNQVRQAGGIPSEMKAAYLEQLGRRELYLSLKEGFLWESLGQRNHMVVPKLNYREQTAESLEQVKSQAGKCIDEQVLLLAVGERALLPAIGDAEGKLDTGTMLAHYNAEFEQHFSRQVERLKLLADEHESVLHARFEVSSEVRYHPSDAICTSRLIIGVYAAGQLVWFTMRFAGEEVVVTNPPEDADELSACIRESRVPQKWIDEGYTVLTFKASEQMEFMSQLNRVADVYAAKLATRSEGNEQTSTVE